VKVGMVGRGVMDAVSVSVGTDVLVFVGIGDEGSVASSVTDTGVDFPEGVQALIRRNKILRTCLNNLFI